MFELKPSERLITDKLFGLHAINMEWGASWPKVNFGGWRNFKTTWGKVEPKKGVWSFELADKEIALAQRYGKEVVLVLGSTPVWASPENYTPSANRLNSDVPRKMEDWRNYVRTVAERYKGKVRIYELWNEPNVKRFFSGSVVDLVALNREAYSIIKQVDNNNIVVSSAMATPGEGSLKYFDEFLRQGGANYADVIGYHFYVAPKPPEAIVDGAIKVKAILDKYNIHKPLWNTETGWNILNHDKNYHDDEKWAGPPLDDEQSMAYVARSYILTWVSGVDRLYWYAWGHRGMGLNEHDAVTPKPIARAYDEIQRWLIGAQMESCVKRADNIWICKLRRGNGYTGMIIWNTAGSIAFQLPATMTGELSIRQLDGKTEKLLDTHGTIQIGMTPVLLETKAP